MRALVIGLLSMIIGSSASAQNYPKRPITMVVPFAAGGPTDTVARVTAESMSKLLGQQVIIENVAGAGGTIGTRRVARSEPDGYTILLHHLGLATSVSLYRNLPFDPMKDLLPVGMVSDVSMAIIARPDYAPNTLAELIADVKKQGDRISFAHSGLGASSQLCGMLFMAAVQTQLTVIPFRGGGPVIQALLGSQVDVGCEQVTTAAPLVQDKRVKAYAVTSSKRLASMQDVPTASEAGLPKFEISVWHGLFVPAGTPEPIVQSLEKALAGALNNPALIKQFAAISTDPTPEKASPRAMRETLANEIDRWRPLIQAAGQFAD